MGPPIPGLPISKKEIPIRFFDTKYPYLIIWRASETPVTHGREHSGFGFPAMNCMSAVVAGGERMYRPSGPTFSHYSSHRRLYSRLNVTNEGREVKLNKLYEEAGLTLEDHVVVDPENPVPNPELGPLERRVSITFEEGLNLETIDKEAMHYWFTEPPQGWQTEKRKLRKAHGVPVDESFDEFRHTGSDVSGRRALGDVRKGDILQGIVVEQLLHHGLRVDVGCVADALIPMRGIELWRSVTVPDIGDRVEVRVVMTSEDPLFRFPLVAAPMDEALAAAIPSVEGYKPSLDLRDVPISRYEEVARLSGREYGSQKVLVMPDDQLMGRVSEKEEFVISDEEIHLFDAIVEDV